MKKLIYSFLFLFLANSLYSEITSIDSVLNGKSNRLGNKQKLLYFKDLSEKYLYKKPALSLLYGKNAYIIAKQNSLIQEIVEIQINTSSAYLLRGDYDNAKNVLIRTINDLDLAQHRAEIGKLLIHISEIYLKTNEYDSSDLFLIRAIQLNSASNDSAVQTEILLAQAQFYLEIREEFKAKEKLKNARSICPNVQTSSLFSRVFFTYGKLYRSLNIWDSCIYYYNRSLDYSLKIKDYNAVIQAYIEMAACYFQEGKYHPALVHIEKAIALSEKHDNTHYLINACIMAGDIKTIQTQYAEALQYFKTAESSIRYMDILQKISFVHNKIANSYMELNDLDAADSCIQKALTLPEELYSLNDLVLVYETTAKYYALKQENEKAFNYYLKFMQFSDSADRLSLEKEHRLLNYKFKSKQKEKQIELLNIRKKQSETKYQRVQITISIIIIAIIIVLLFSVIIFIVARKIQKSNRLLRDQGEQIKNQKEEILEQRNNLEKLYHSLTCQKERIEIQRDVLAQKNSHITEGIKYAKLIQKEILLSELEIKKFFPESFLLYLPKDIVSGDFYLMQEQGNTIYFGAVDCTGHGIPGAFMSLVGYYELSEILNRKNFIHPADVLMQLNERVNNTLHQNQIGYTNKEGMDMAFCAYHKDSFELEYAGAFNPLYLIRNTDLIEFKADPYPVGVTTNEQNISFTNHRINLISGDMLYIFTDGFIDQFGGKKRKKFLRKRFKETLLDISFQPMKKQKELLLHIFLDWKGSYEQIDDVLIIGIKIPELGK